MNWSDATLNQEVFVIIDRGSDFEIKSGIIAEKIESIDGNLLRVKLNNPPEKRVYVDAAIVEPVKTGAEIIKSLADTLIALKKSDLDSKATKEKAKVDNKRLEDDQ